MVFVMSENRFDPEDEPSFSPPEEEESPPWDAPSASEGASPSFEEQSSFAWEMAKMWIKEHQTTAMLGAFAVGVFAGALFRE